MYKVKGELKKKNQQGIKSFKQLSCKSLLLDLSIRKSRTINKGGSMICF